MRRLLEASPAAALERDASMSWLPLHIAAYISHDAMVRLLFAAAPAATMAADSGGWLPLHYAARSACEAVVRLEVAPAAAMVADAAGWLPLHYAAFNGDEAVVRLLLEAVPQAAAAVDAMGRTPLQLAHDEGHTSTAFALLSAGPAAAVLATLAAGGAAALMLLPDFLLAPGRLPGAAADWALVHSPCPSIESALPAAPACGPGQAAQVVWRLQPAEAARLRLAALCLGRHGLPGFVAAPILARCA